MTADKKFFARKREVISRIPGKCCRSRAGADGDRASFNLPSHYVEPSMVVTHDHRVQQCSRMLLRSLYPSACTLANRFPVVRSSIDSRRRESIARNDFRLLAVFERKVTSDKLGQKGLSCLCIFAIAI